MPAPGRTTPGNLSQPSKQRILPIVVTQHLYRFLKSGYHPRLFQGDPFMEHPDITLEIEMKYEPEFESYVPHVAGLADDSLYRGKMSFEECVDALTFLADFLSSHNLLDIEDHPDDMDKVSAGTEQLLLEAMYQVHSRWHAPGPGDEDDACSHDHSEIEEP
jgi:hypothetical protein